MDSYAPDGGVYYGDRLVRKNGRIKFAGIWWEDKKLIPYIGKTVGVRVEDYWVTEIAIYTPSYPDGQFLFVIRS